MALNKFDGKSDGIADLYRAALYLAKGSRNIGINFLEKAKNKLGWEIVKVPEKLETHRQQLVFAEKILDQYLRLKSL